MSSRRIVDAPPAATWPFRYPLCPELPPGPVEIRAFDVDDAYVNAQTGGTQLVTTQKKYLDAEWAAAFARHGDALLTVSEDTEKNGGHGEHGAMHPLARAFRLANGAERLAACVDFLKHGRTPPALVATASACMEVNDFDAAARDLDEAIAQAPGWAAAHFERGKLWLRQDDMVRASDSFRRAARTLHERRSDGGK